MNKGMILAAFALLFGAAFAVMGNATATDTYQSEWGGLTSADSVYIQGGNVSDANVYTNTSTQEWGGFFGNVSGYLVLAQAVDTLSLFDWAWTSGNATVCASTNSNFPFGSVASGTDADISTAWTNLASGSDAANETFTVAAQPVWIGGAVKTGDAADTNGAYQTVVLNNGTVSTSNDLVFCVGTGTGNIYKGNTGNYEMIVPTGYNTVVRYYFYAELY